MFFYRFKPRSTHLHRYEAEMHRRFLSRKCKLVRTLPGLQICKFYERCDGDWIYFVIDVSLARSIKRFSHWEASRKPNPCILGFCALTKIPRWMSHEVAMLYVNPEHRGKGISSLIYDAILGDGVILVSGKMQNAAARRIWIRLVKDPRYTVWAQDLMNLKRTALVSVEDDELNCSLKLYRDLKMRRRKQTEDMRLICCLL